MRIKNKQAFKVIFNKIVTKKTGIKFNAVESKVSKANRKKNDSALIEFFTTNAIDHGLEIVLLIIMAAFLIFMDNLINAKVPLNTVGRGYKIAVLQDIIFYFVDEIISSSLYVGSSKKGRVYNIGMFIVNIIRGRSAPVETKIEKNILYLGTFLVNMGRSMLDVDWFGILSALKLITFAAYLRNFVEAADRSDADERARVFQEAKEEAFRAEEEFYRQRDKERQERNNRYYEKYKRQQSSGSGYSSRSGSNYGSYDSGARGNRYSSGRSSGYNRSYGGGYSSGSSSSTQDHLNTLGIKSSRPTAKEIKKAYYAKSKEYHPDVTGGDDAMQKKINSAYEALKGMFTEQFILYDFIYTTNS